MRSMELRCRRRRSSSAHRTTTRHVRLRCTGKGSMVAFLIAALMVIPGHLAQLEEGSECELLDGSPGICKLDNDCEWLKLSLQRRSISFRDIVRCSFSRNDVIICCGDVGGPGVDPRTSHTTTTTPTTPLDGADWGIVFPDYHFHTIPRSTHRTLLPTVSTRKTTTVNPIRHIPQPTHSPVLSPQNNRENQPNQMGRPPVNTTPFPQPLTTNEIFEINQNLVLTTTRVTLNPTLHSTKHPSSKQPRFERIQMLPLNTNGVLQPMHPTSVEPLKIINNPPPSTPGPNPSNLIHWPTSPLAPALPVPVHTTVHLPQKPPIWVTTPVPKPTTSSPSFWSQWSPNKEVTPIHQNGLDNSHTHELPIPTSTVRPTTLQVLTAPSSPPKRSTTQAAASILTDSWLLDLLEEARKNGSADQTRLDGQTNGGAVSKRNPIGPTVLGNNPSNDIDIYPTSYEFPPPEIRPTTTTTGATTVPEVTPTTVPTITTSSTLPTRLGGRRRLEEACDRWAAISSTVLSFHILGGTTVELGEFPHMAALGYPSQEINTDFDFDCGGTLISEEYILTAGHCVVTRNLPTVVRMGAVNLHSLDDPGITMNIAEIIPYPSYVTSSFYNDIALVRLALPLVFTDNVRPACLRADTADLPSDAEPIVTGWGKIEDKLRSIEMLKANLSSMNLEPCNAALQAYYISFGSVRKLRNGIITGQMCAYDPAGKRDACQGDSGGPIQLTESNGLSTVVGVTSFGVNCGSSLPSVYTRVASYADWIESIVWPSST